MRFNTETLDYMIRAVHASVPATPEEEVTRSYALDDMYRAYAAQVAATIPAPFTKADVLHPLDLESWARTPFVANGTGSCSQCHTPLATEADFYAHFVVTDRRYLNLGTCPNAS